ncbi:MAG: dTMP kinase [Spirochaetaceae bacterium]|jgi:dTMP kinase|nr:dTMP kinase [Spirochaetaceae bacterium]
MVLHRFIVFEGLDGAGTSTQIDRLKEVSTKQLVMPNRFWFTAEPSDGETGKRIRHILKGREKASPEELARLFSDDRNEHLYGVGGIVEHCNKGLICISDRYTPSSLVYQGLECGFSLPKTLNKDFPLPQILFFFDIDPEIAAKRMENRPEKEIFEYLDFQKRAREAYKSIIPEYAAQDTDCRLITIDAALPIEDISRTIEQIITDYI